jgi:DNA-binding CsgD family transcriptional regulator
MAAKDAATRSAAHKRGGASRSLSVWKRRLKEMAAFKKKFGHCRVSTLDEEHASLGNWVRTQRCKKHRNKLAADHVRELDKLGFVWDISQWQWQPMFAALVEYKKVHGNCSVSMLDKKHRTLGCWVQTQRSKKKKGTLTQEQIRLLNELGFSWCFPKSTSQSARKREAKRELERSHRARWESHYNALAAYQRAHGHCLVPISPKERSDLKSWVSWQRVLRRKGKLSEDRVRRLDKLGFVWNPSEDQWERMLAALLEYQKVHGNCNVPFDWSENPQLGNWVVTQRNYHRKGLLRPERRERLAAIGFRWPNVTGTLSTPRIVTDVGIALTRSEAEVLRQLACGLTNKEIAEALHISYETVKGHVQHVLRKIGVTNRTQAAMWALRKELA